jgi:hypothetical protein
MNLLTALFATSLFATTLSVSHPFPKPIKNLVTFGDSYTSAISVGDRGTPWPVYAAGYGKLSLHDFAISGATCSNLLTPRPFGSVFENQLPNFEASVANKSLLLNPEETVFTLWIGTNDVGDGALLTGNQVNSSVSIVDTTRCAINWLNVLYKQGWRNFIYQNVRSYSKSTPLPITFGDL